MLQKSSIFFRNEFQFYRSSHVVIYRIVDQKIELRLGQDRRRSAAQWPCPSPPLAGRWCEASQRAPFRTSLNNLATADMLTAEQVRPKFSGGNLLRKNFVPLTMAPSAPKHRLEPGRKICATFPKKMISKGPGKRFTGRKVEIIPGPFLGPLAISAT